MSTSNVPQITIDENGVAVPETAAVLDGVLADYNVAFGGNLNISNPATPQGVLASETTSNIVGAYEALALLVSMVDPATSEGRFQDALGRIYFLTRKPATATTVEALCTGSPGIVLPAGSLAEDDAGYTYESTSDATFDAGGEATVNFQCQTTGAIACGIGALTKIAQTSPGWDAITNLSAGVVGVPEENRRDFEVRRYASVAANAHGSAQTIFGAVSNITGVSDCYVTENTTAGSVDTGPTNYALAPHSVYVAVVGGDDTEIARAIWSKKSLGCNYNGDTTVVIQDDSVFEPPYPSYSVKFERPSSLAIKVAVSIANNAKLPANIVDLVKEAVLAAFNGEDGGDRARIAATVYASRYYSGVAATSPVTAIVSILVGTSTADATSVSVGIDQVPTLTASDITVTLV